MNSISPAFSPQCCCQYATMIISAEGAATISDNGNPVLSIDMSKSATFHWNDANGCNPNPQTYSDFCLNAPCTGYNCTGPAPSRFGDDTFTFTSACTGGATFAASVEVSYACSICSLNCSNITDYAVGTNFTNALNLCTTPTAIFFSPLFVGVNTFSDHCSGTPPNTTNFSSMDLTTTITIS